MQDRKLQDWKMMDESAGLENAGLKIDRLSVFTRKQLLLSAHLSHRNSVCLSVTQVDQSKTVPARITKSLPSGAWKTLVTGTVKLFHKFERGYPERGC